MSTWSIINLFVFYPLLGAAALALIIFLIIRRVKEKRNETFEKRDN